LGPEKTSCRESRDIVFFEDGLPSPTLNDLPLWPVDADKSVTQPVLDHSIKSATPPDAANAPTLSPPSAAAPTALPEVTHQPVSAPTPHPHITIRLPGRGMNRPAAPTARALRTSPQTSTTMTRTRTRTTDPTRMPIHLPVLSTTFGTCQVIIQSRYAQASFAMEEGVEIVLCWMKQRILLWLFRPVYQVAFGFRSCLTHVA